MNPPRLPRLVLFPILLLVVVLSGCSEPTDQELISSAKQSLEDGEIRAAVIDLKRVLQRSPQQAQARWLLGNVYMEIGDFLAAEKELLAARQAGIEAASVDLALAHIYLNTSQFDKILALPLPPAGSHAFLDARGLRAMAYVAMGKPDQAAKLADSILQVNDRHVLALLAKARVAGVDKDLKAARGYVQRALAVSPSSGAAWSLLGNIEQRGDHLEAAEQAYRKAVEARLYDVRDRVRLALVRLELGKQEAAKRDVAALIKRYPKNPDIYYVSGLIHYINKQYDEAQLAFEKALSHQGDHDLALFHLAATHYMLGHLEQANRYLRAFLNINPGDIRARKILAVLELNLDHNQRAEELVRPIVAQQAGDQEALNILSVALLQQGKVDEGIAMLEKIVNLDPDSPLARIKLGAGLILNGRVSSAAENLQRAIELDPDSVKADQMLAQLYLKRKVYDKAWQVAQRLQQRKPDSPVSYNMEASILLAQGKEKAARGALDHALQLDPGDPFANHQLAAFALRKGELGKAMDYYRKVLAEHADHLPTERMIAKLELRQGQHKQAIVRMEKVVAAAPQELEPRLELARVYLADDRTVEARQLLDAVKLRYNNNPDWLRTYGEVQLAEQDNAGAVYTFQRLIRRRPDSMAHYFLAMAYDQQGQRDELKRHVAEALRLDPDNWFARLGAVKLALAEGRLAEADTQLKSLLAEKPDDIQSLELEARVARALQQPDRAEAALRKRYALNPKVQYMLAYAQQQWHNGRQQACVDTIEQWLGRYPRDVHALLGLANAYAGLGDEAKAASYFEQALVLDPDNLAARNNLAWNLRHSDPDAALANAQRAYSSKPDSPLIMDTLAYLYLQRGELDKAERLLGRALQQSPDNPDIRYHQALLLLRKGQRGAARDALSALLAEGKPFSLRDEAQQTLQSLQN